MKRQLGRYELIKTVGAGGMARIYLACIPGPAGFEKPIALKTIHRHLAQNEHFIDLFLNEARLATKLQHPNVIQIFELGQADGTYYMAMEFLAGESVNAIIKECMRPGGHRLDVRQACHIVMQACEGLHYAHELREPGGTLLGVVHRDISPHNLFVTYDGGVKLMDFGIARAVGEIDEQTGPTFAGKIPYMSPEQVQGDPLDRRSDIFSLGAVLWELLAGEYLFRGQSSLDSVTRVMDIQPAKLGHKRFDVPTEVDNVVQKALAKSREDRFQTALEFHQALGRAAARLGAPVSSHELAETMRNWFKERVEASAELVQGSLSAQRPAAGPDDRASLLPEGKASGGDRRGATNSLSDRSFYEPNDDDDDDEPERPSWVTTFSSGVLVSATRNLPRGLRPRQVAVAAVLLVALVILCVGGMALVSGDDSAEVGASQPVPSQSPGPVVPAATTGSGIAGEARGEGERESSARGAPESGESPQSEQPASSSSGSAQSPVPAPGGGDPEGGDSPSSDSSSSPEQPVAGTPTPSDPAGDGEITLQLVVRPQHAKVTVDGRPVVFEEFLRLPRSRRAVEISVSAPGYHARTFRLVPDRDRLRRIDLRLFHTGPNPPDDGPP